MPNNPSLYLESTIPSYLAAWPASDVKQAAKQQATHNWWNDQRKGIMERADKFFAIRHRRLFRRGSGLKTQSWRG